MNKTNDLSELLCAVDAVLRDALDRVDVQPCDENNDHVKSLKLIDEMKQLYLAKQKYDCT